MTKTIPRGRKKFLILLCALLLFGQVFSRPAYADGSKDVEISYTVTEDMLPKASPSPTPSATPHPGKGQPPKTGDEYHALRPYRLRQSAGRHRAVLLYKEQGKDRIHR